MSVTVLNNRTFEVTIELQSVFNISTEVSMSTDLQCFLKQLNKVFKNVGEKLTTMIVI